jgi:hypothetical protein
VRHRSGGCGRTGMVRQHARPPCIVHRMLRHEVHTRGATRPRAGRDARTQMMRRRVRSCTAARMRTRVPRLSISEYLAPRACSGGGPGKAGGGEQMLRRERLTDAQRTPPLLVEKPKDKTTPDPGPKQPARARPGARQKRIEQRTPYTRIGPVSPLAGYCAWASRLVPLRSLECPVACGERSVYPIFMSSPALAPAPSSYFPSFTHPSHPAPTRLGNLYLSPLSACACRCAAQRTWELGRRPAPFLGVGVPV